MLTYYTQEDREKMVVVVMASQRQSLLHGRPHILLLAEPREPQRNSKIKQLGGQGFTARTNFARLLMSWFLAALSLLEQYCCFSGYSKVHIRIILDRSATTWPQIESQIQHSSDSG